jgi:hypothetical protein
MMFLRCEALNMTAQPGPELAAAVLWQPSDGQIFGENPRDPPHFERNTEMNETKM